MEFTGGPKPYGARDRSEFAQSLDRVLTRAITLRDKALKKSESKPQSPEP